MLPVQSTDRKNLVRPSAAFSNASATTSCKIVQWRTTADANGHYSFAMAL